MSQDNEPFPDTPSQSSVPAKDQAADDDSLSFTEAERHRPFPLPLTYLIAGLLVGVLSLALWVLLDERDRRISSSSQASTPISGSSNPSTATGGETIHLKQGQSDLWRKATLLRGHPYSRQSTVFYAIPDFNLENPVPSNYCFALVHVIFTPALDAATNSQPRGLTSPCSWRWPVSLRDDLKPGREYQSTLRSGGNAVSAKSMLSESVATPLPLITRAWLERSSDGETLTLNWEPVPGAALYEIETMNIRLSSTGTSFSEEPTLALFTHLSTAWKSGERAAVKITAYNQAPTLLDLQKSEETLALSITYLSVFEVTSPDLSRNLVCTDSCADQYREAVKDDLY